MEPQQSNGHSWPPRYEDATSFEIAPPSYEDAMKCSAHPFDNLTVPNITNHHPNASHVLREFKL